MSFQASGIDSKKRGMLDVGQGKVAYFVTEQPMIGV